MDAVPPPLGLGEVVLRVRDLDAMQRFYQDVFGLTLLRRFERRAFLKVASGRAGHTTTPATELYNPRIRPSHASSILVRRGRPKPAARRTIC